jgi:DNA polymerase-3 subunit beta
MEIMLASHLKNHLKTLSPALGGASLPILDCVHFTDGRMIATNLEATIEVACDLTLAASIPQKVLKTFLQTLSATDEIRLGSKDGNLVFSTPSGDTELAGLAVEDRPEIRELGEVVASAKVEGGFVTAFTEVAVAASTDESRQVLTGVFVEAGDGTVQLTATDSYRLHHDEVASSVQGEAQAVVPPRYLKALPGVEPLLIEFGEDRVRFTEGSVTVTCRIIEGAFPNYRQLLPAITSTTVVMEDRSDRVDKILRSFERLGEKFGNNLPVVIDFCPGTQQARATLKLVDVGEHSAELILESCQGEQLHIAFNAKFLRCAVSFAGRTLEMTDALKPAVLNGSGENRYALLMPVRLS